MHYYELTITAQLGEDIGFICAGDRIGKSINRLMLEDSELTKLHGRDGFKHYVFNSFYPVEKDGVYKAGRVYVFKIRSLNEDFAKRIKPLLSKSNIDFFRVLSIQSRTVKESFLSNLYTVTPVIVTTELGRNWAKEDDIILLQKRLQANLEKKYNDFFGVEFQKEEGNPFIQRIELLNKKPIAIQYKKTKFLGNKFKIWVNEDEKSQKLAFIAMACGCGEKNTSVGAGFCTGGDRE